MQIHAHQSTYSYHNWEKPEEELGSNSNYALCSQQFRGHATLISAAVKCQEKMVPQYIFEFRVRTGGLPFSR
jgi:hypothetical protein